MGKFGAFIAGGAFGAIAALLLSPHSGEENREILADKIDYYSSHGEDVLHQGTDAIRDRVQNVTSQAPAATDDLKQKINEARDRIADQVTRRREDARPVDAEVVDDIDDIDDAAAADANSAATA